MKLWVLPMLWCVTSAQAGDAERVFASVHNSVVTVTTFDERNQIDGEGSGVAINPGQVVTNCHVVQEATMIRVRAGDKELDASWILKDVPRDLCLLEVKGLTAPAVKIRGYAEIQVGEPVYAIGNPLGFGLAASAGIVSSISEVKGQPQIFTSAPISPGSSGGGLFDAQNRLIGITTRFFGGAQNLNVAAPADWVLELPQRGKPVKESAVTISADPDWPGEAELLRTASQWTKLAEQSRLWRVAYPTSVLANAYLGLALFNLKQLDEAKQVFLTALHHDPRHPLARGYLALTYHALGEKEAAMEEIQRVISLAPSSAYFHRVLAEWQRSSGDIAVALMTAQMAVRLGPGDEMNWQLLGNIRYQQQQFKEAVEAYRAALRLKPNDPAVTTNLASALTKLGEPATARQTLMTTPVNQVQSAEVWVSIGVAEEKQGRYAEAERAYRSALEINPVLPVAWYDLANTLLRTNRTQEAETALRQAVKYQPEFAQAWANLGTLLGHNGDKVGAKEAFEKATAADASFAAGWYKLGELLRGLNDPRGAVTALEKVSQLDPLNAAAWAMLGEMWLRMEGRKEEAFAALQKAEKIDPKNTLALQSLTMYYGGRGDYGKSLDYAERALALDSAPAASWSNKGYALLKLGRYPEAVQSFETAVRLEPGFANAWINLGEAHLRQKQIGKAITALERALTLAPTASDARLYLAQAFAATNQGAKAMEHLDTLLRQAPDLVPAWYLRTAIHLSQNNRPEALVAYAKLKSLNPSVARELRGRLPAGVNLPE
jgi:tetratricopeptide (TPR) repeat protein